MAMRALTDEDLEPLRRELAELRALLQTRGAGPRWGSPEQAAELLGVTAKTVRRWAVAGRLKAERAGAHWRIDLAALPSGVPATSPEALGRAALAALPR